MTFVENTKRAYKVHRKSYIDFCNNTGSEPVPAATTTVCQYIVYLSDRLCFNSIKQYINIVKLMHLDHRLADPLNAPRIQWFLQGLKRFMGCGVTRKSPITPQLLGDTDIYSTLDKNSLLDTGLWAACVVSFFAMLRRSNVTVRSKNEISSYKGLTRSDFLVTKDQVVVHVGWTKTIQFKDRMLSLP